MPLYEYQCPKCGRFEVIRKFSDEPLTICPTCGSEIQKLASAPAIQFKGTGWYVTDYAKKTAARGEVGQVRGRGSSDSKSDAKSDSKSRLEVRRAQVRRRRDGAPRPPKPSKDGGSKS